MLHAGVDVEEEGQVEVAIAPLALLVIDARLLVLANDTLLRARWRDLLQRTGVVQGVDHLESSVVRRLPFLGQRALSHDEDDLGGVLTAVERSPWNP